MIDFLEYTLEFALLGLYVHELEALEISNLPEDHLIDMHETEDDWDVGALEGF
jgi:hypothetical protein